MRGENEVENFEMGRSNSSNNSSENETKRRILSQDAKSKSKNLSNKYKETIGRISVCLSIKNKLVRVFLAELFGTFLFLSIALGSVAQFVFGIGEITFVSMAISFGFGLMAAIVVCGKVSGGHYNPAVSFAFLLTGRLSVLRFFVYVIAQNLGAFLASIMVYLAYLNEFQNFPEGHFSIETSAIFGTLPRNITSSSGAETFSLFFDQFFATALFITVILAVCDENNTPADMPHVIKALFIGFALMIIGTGYGINCGFAVNPARDFGPRMFTLIFGWGSKVFKAGPYFFWIPIVAPMVGSFFSVIFYNFFIGNHLEHVENFNY